MVPASAIGKPQAALEAMASWMRTLRPVRKRDGQEAAAGAEECRQRADQAAGGRKPARATAGRAAAPSLPVRSPGRSIRHADQPMKAAKKAAMSLPGKRADHLRAEQRADHDAGREGLHDVPAHRPAAVVRAHARQRREQDGGERRGDRDLDDGVGQETAGRRGSSPGTAP